MNGRPDPVRSGFVWPDPVCLACPIADWCVAASASGLRLHRCCINVGATASTSASVGGLASSVRLCRCVFVGLYVFVEAVWLWYLWSVVSVDGVVGGLVCGCWMGA